ncbi:MAG: DUF1304 domain-containing protein [Rhodoglobus sp.]|nr:DUF1304 domain-containing protein [Rhodoglobus sp.]
MNNVALIIGAVFLSLAALVHVYIFMLESVLWSTPSTWRGFGVKTQSDADVVRPMAFNQGFYNLFLAIGVALGLLLMGTGHTASGVGIALFAASSMLAAAVVLIVSSPKLARAAAIQGSAPLIGIVLVTVAVVTSAIAA